MRDAPPARRALQRPRRIRRTLAAMNARRLPPDGPLVRRMVRIMRRLHHDLTAPAFPRPMPTPFRLRTGTRHPPHQDAVHRMPSLTPGRAGLFPFPGLAPDEVHAGHRNRGEIA